MTSGMVSRHFCNIDLMQNVFCVYSGGRKSSDIITADTASRSKYFNAVTYSADGACILAGGKSKYVCIYAVKTGALVKKFELSHNRSVQFVLKNIDG